VCGESGEEWPDFAVAQKRLLLASPIHHSTGRLREYAKRRWEWGWAASLGGAVLVTLSPPVLVLRGLVQRMKAVLGRGALQTTSSGA